jgi:hypothetical protein
MLGQRGLVWLALGVCLVAAGALRVWFTTSDVSPWIMVDELIFSEQARSIAHHGSLDVRGQSYGVFSLVYPLLIAPAWLFSSGKEAYEIAKGINAALVTLGAVPLYLWARRLLPMFESILVCALALLIPPLLLAGNVMSDNAFFSAFLFAGFSIALALERPTYGRQALALGAVALACAVRLQGLVFVLVLPTAVLLHVLLEPEASRGVGAALRRSVRSFRPTVFTFAAVGLAYAAVVLGVGASWSSALGGYQVTTRVGYSVSDAARWVAYQFGELELASGFLAIPALLTLLAWAVRRRAETTSAERAFLAVTVSALFWLGIQTGVFASRFADRVEERLMFCVTPLLLLALVLWLWRLPRVPMAVKAVAFAIPAALLLALPLGRLLTPAIYSDTFGLIPFATLLGSISLGAIRRIVIGTVVVTGALFVFGPRALVQLVVPTALAGFLAVSSVTSFRHMAKASRAEEATSQAGDRVAWIDAAIGSGAHAGFLLTPEVDPRALWQLEFWNQALGPVYVLGQTEPGGLPNTAVTIDPRDGNVEGSGSRPLPPYVVLPKTYAAAGDAVARQGYWVLYRARAPLRLTSRVLGVAPDSWIGHRASDTVYRAPPTSSSTMTVRVSRASWGGTDLPSPVRIEARSLRTGRVLATRTWVVHSLATKTFSLGRLPEPYRVSVSVKRTFSPANFGLADERQLGAQVAFELGQS